MHISDPETALKCPGAEIQQFMTFVYTPLYHLIKWSSVKLVARVIPAEDSG